MNLSQWHIAVLIPAHNEEELLPRCLQSVEKARAKLPFPVSSDVVVVIDDSKDKSYLLAEKLLAGRGSVTRTEARCVGLARARAACLALQRYDGDATTCWLANTDADCEVPEDWLVQQFHYAVRGWNAVAGIVDVDTFEGHTSVVMKRFRDSYIIHPDGTHPHVHGANMGMRADTYLEAGGWSALHTAEDHHLWNRLKHGTPKLLSDARLIVSTSGRRVGRAPNGFAAALAAHDRTAV